MYTDIILIEKNEYIEKLAKHLGYDKLFFKEDFDKLKIKYGSTIDKNRYWIENKKVKLLINPHVESREDKLNEVKTGLNQVILKLANKNKIILGLSLDQFSNVNSLGKVIKMITLCRKYKVPIYVFSLAKTEYEIKSPYDIISLLKISGMTPGEAKAALTINLK